MTNPTTMMHGYGFNFHWCDWHKPCPICDTNNNKKENEMSNTTQYVLDFADNMERKLSLNRHKGDREGWLSMSYNELTDRLYEELDELKLSISNKNNVQNVIDEASDVANFAMFIADKYKNENNSDR